jgi:phosphatidylglycerophosphate synthase
MMNSSTTRTARRLGVGLYDIKPAFQHRLAGLADLLTALGVHPDVLTLAGLACGLAGGAALATGLVLNQPAWLWCVPLFALARLAFNALDGMVAVRAGVARAWGKVLNEFCDRLADLAFLAPLLLVPGLNPILVTAALCMTLLVSYLGVLAEAAGAPRQYGGVMGKADRMACLGLATVATAATGLPLALQVLPYVLLVGGGLTLVQRGVRTHAVL